MLLTNKSNIKLHTKSQENVFRKEKELKRQNLCGDKQDNQNKNSSVCWKTISVVLACLDADSKQNMQRTLKNKTLDLGHQITAFACRFCESNDLELNSLNLSDKVKMICISLFIVVEIVQKL